MTTLNSLLTDLPRVHLGHMPTPLELLPRMTKELGGPNIWVKRDDCTGLATGGNKTRKLEYLLGEAAVQGADSIVTFGAIQSNHARQTAAACARTGLNCHLFLTDQVTSKDPRYKSGGNVLLDRLTGAKLHFFAPDDADAMRAKLAELREHSNLYVIPAGGSNATGAIGYVGCAEEIMLQSADLGINPQTIVHASSSAGTQAGLVWGLTALGATTDVLGINVYHPDPVQLHNRINELLGDLDARFETNYKNLAKIQVNHAYLADGYGQLNPQTTSAIILAARLEGLLFDPVYSGKALFALIDQITIGAFDKTSDVVLIHTGGSPALNVYEDLLYQSFTEEL